MRAAPLTSEVFVAPQMSAADVTQAAELGVKLIICNRPDGEAEDQPSATAIASEARKAGIRFRDMPVTPNAIDDGAVAAFREALSSVDGPVLAYCRSGKRSAMLWALAVVGDTAVDTVLAIAAAGGYDLNALRGRLRVIAAQRTGAPLPA